MQPRRPKRPNILYVTADDLGEQVGCYGDAIARTPNIDALAAMGTKFSNAYVTQASCSPSRSSLLTGLYPHQNGQVGLTNRGYGMKPNIPNLPTLLHDAGYRTGIIGKLHVAPEKAFAFDYAQMATQATLRCAAWLLRRASSSRAPKRTNRFFSTSTISIRTRPFKNRWTVCQKIRSPPEDVKPLPFNGINSPQALQSVADFYNGTTRLDAGLGMIMDVLKETGHDKDTIIVFIGDHGAPFPRGKTSCYEGGVRVPLIVKMPAQTEAQTVDAMVSSVDIVPTLLRAAKVEKHIETAGDAVATAVGGRQFWGTQILGDGVFRAHFGGVLSAPFDSGRAL